MISGKLWHNNTFYPNGELFKIEADEDGRIRLEDGESQCQLCGLICTNEMAYFYHRKTNHGVGKVFNSCPFCEGLGDMNFKAIRCHVVRDHMGIKKFTLPDGGKNEGRRYGQRSGGGKDGPPEEERKTEEVILMEDSLANPEKYLKKLDPHTNEAITAPPAELEKFLRDVTERKYADPPEVTNADEANAWDIAKLKRPKTDQSAVKGDKICFECNPPTSFDYYHLKMRHICADHMPPGVSAFECHFCQMTFASESQATQHLMKHHGPQIETESLWMRGEWGTNCGF